MYQSFWKPAIDRIAGAILLALLAPLLIAIAIAVRTKLGSPILFRQKRPGLQGKVFTLLKFRTMTSLVDSRGQPLPDSQRLTKFGRLLRSTSLDELPTLLNVLRNDMSLVGPRPLLCRYLDRYSKEQARRHEVKPGITGWAQVNGRNTLSWEQKFAHDVWYVDHVSLGLDVRIIARTIVKVFMREGVEQEGQATVMEFMGTRSCAADSDHGD